MKPCTVTHFENIEPGDRITLTGNRDDDEPSEVTITVRRRFKTNNFGPVLESVEGETYYLHDYDDYTEAKP